MGLDVYSRIVVGVELKDLITFCGTVNDPVTKYNPDTGEPYETTVSRKVYRLLDGREITVEDLDGGHPSVQFVVLQQFGHSSTVAGSTPAGT